MGDVAQILGLGDAASKHALLGSSALPSTGKGGAGKKPEGVNREVLSLLGSASALPSVVPSGGRIREMLLRKEIPATRWLWTEFGNSARADGVQLKHWQRAANVSLDYAFSRFNRKTAVVHYSGDEYAQAVVPQDGASAVPGAAAPPAAAQPELPQSPAWSKEETDVLFSMCDEFNLRWYVIEDRWPLTPRRSVAELKDRYYGVARAVLLSRRSRKSKQLGRQLSIAAPLADGDALLDESFSGEDAAPGGGPALTALLNSNSSSSSSSSSIDSAFSVAFLAQRLPTSTAKVTAKAAGLCENAIVDFSFDRAHEERRVQQLGALFSRSQAEEKEETSLVNEVRRIDALLRRLQKDAPKARKSTASTKGGVEGAEGGGSGVSAAAPVAAAPVAAATSAAVDAAAAASAPGAGAAAPAARAATAAESGQVTLTQFPPTLLEQLLSEEGYRGQHASLALEPGVHLRSSRFHVLPSQIGIGSRLHLKMDNLLTEIGVPLRPVPTINVCNAYDRLRQDTLKLLALQAKLFDVRGELAALQGLPQPLRPGQTKATARVKKGVVPGLAAAGAASSTLAAGGQRKAAKKATGQGSPGKRVKVKLEAGDEAFDSDDGWSEAGLEDVGGVKRKALPAGGGGGGVKHKKKKVA
jgi:hypothetical protein